MLSSVTQQIQKSYKNLSDFFVKKIGPIPEKLLRDIAPPLIVEPPLEPHVEQIQGPRRKIQKTKYCKLPP